MTKARSILARALSRIWFRTLRVEGPGLPDGAVLLVLNHPNGLLDPLVVSALVKPVPRFLAKSTLWNILLLRPFLALFQAIPVERAQDISDPESRARATARAFEAVHRAIGERNRVGLFPEGISHGNAQLAQLKTGAARMALSSPVKPALVPAGLVYGQRELFRHNALLRLGDAIEYGDLFSEGDDPAAVKALTERIRQALLPLTLHGPGDALQRLAEDLAWLLAEAPKERADLEALRSRSQALISSLADLNEEERTSLRSRVDEAKGWLEEQGLRPDQVGFSYPGARVRAWMGKALLHHATALFIAPAALLFWPPYRFTAWLTHRLTDEVDVIATYKLIGGLLFLPAWAALLLGLAAWRWGLAGAAVVLALAVLAFLSLPLFERLKEDWQAIRGYRRRGHPDAAGLLKAKKELLAVFPQLR
ncbi:MAG: 1-acyl-sn-glycerol-3-phosphate acyltransferase, partial [Acidobacteriota bacterium]|nr:1-acyl-sn-glycerol-3-phosphate acyltransferase [Acidobacteriota bacterium]